jgi:hypothetical protein
VVQNHPLRFTRSHCRAARIRAHSCSFVFIRGSKRPAAKPLQDRSRAGKPDLHKFVSIRVHSWFKTTPCVSPAATARAARIRGYSCSFVVQNHPPRSPFRTDLGLESPTYINSCPFVFIRGSKPPPAFHPQPQPRCTNSWLFVSIRGSKPPPAFHPQPQPRCTNSWLFVSIRGSKLQPCVSPAATARAARIRGYSCPFVVQNHPLRFTRSHSRAARCHIFRSPARCHHRQGSPSG